ncbi:nucleotidyltransferase family protein [Pedobacter jamesrossensis]|uniref:Nucleotidyltransferase family protein n=1 Tax=Pedobacter jamesrossensis TaxID=1908238 RepID=A0ABV8NII7_9SPHI
MEPILNKEKIVETLKKEAKKLADFGVLEIGLFGSFIRNEQTINSDIDLLIDIKKEKKTFKNFMSLNYFLEDIFKRKVELVTKQSLSPFIGPHILKAVEYVALPN